MMTFFANFGFDSNPQREQRLIGFADASPDKAPKAPQETTPDASQDSNKELIRVMKEQNDLLRQGMAQQQKIIDSQEKRIQFLEQRMQQPDAPQNNPQNNNAYPALRNNPAMLMPNNGDIFGYMVEPRQARGRFARNVNRVANRNCNRHQYKRYEAPPKREPQEGDHRTRYESNGRGMYHQYFRNGQWVDGDVIRSATDVKAEGQERTRIYEYNKQMEEARYRDSVAAGKAYADPDVRRQATPGARSRMARRVIDDFNEQRGGSFTDQVGPAPERVYGDDAMRTESGKIEDQKTGATIIFENQRGEDAHVTVVQKDGTRLDLGRRNITGVKNMLARGTLLQESRVWGQESNDTYVNRQKSQADAREQAAAVERNKPRDPEKRFILRVKESEMNVTPAQLVTIDRMKRGYNMLDSRYVQDGYGNTMFYSTSGDTKKLKTAIIIDPSGKPIGEITHRSSDQALRRFGNEDWRITEGMVSLETEDFAAGNVPPEESLQDRADKANKARVEKLRQEGKIKFTTEQVQTMRRLGQEQGMTHFKFAPGDKDNVLVFSKDTAKTVAYVLNVQGTVVAQIQYTQLDEAKQKFLKGEWKGKEF